jgi:hypothetical protein
MFPQRRKGAKVKTKNEIPKSFLKTLRLGALAGDKSDIREDYFAQRRQSGEIEFDFLWLFLVMLPLSFCFGPTITAVLKFC